MKFAKIPENEISRIRTLHSLKLLDTQPEDIYERATRISKQAFNAPMSCVCFVDTNRVWFKSKQGVDISEINRDISICGHAINQEITDDKYSRLFEITDTLKDDRFVDNPLVINAPMVRYYLGYVLRSVDGENLGTLCIMDSNPRTASNDDKSLLIELGEMLNERLSEIQVTNSFDFDDIAIASSIAYKMFGELDQSLKKRGISLTEWKVLDKVIQSSFSTPTQISKQLNIACSQVSKTLELLEAKGFITRLKSVKNTDRRLVKLECNPQGREIWNYGKRLSKEIVEKLRMH